MIRKIDQLVDEWEEKVRRKSLYCSGGEKIILEEFSRLFRETFEIIMKVNNEFVYQSIAPQSPLLTMDYLKLIAVAAQYSACDCISDTSQQKAFTATCLVAQNLVACATSPSGSYRTEKGTVLFDTEERCQGDLYFAKAELDADLDPPKYNIFQGDFEEVLQLAAQLSDDAH